MAEPKIPHIPTATYRLQFRNGMTFDRAADLIPYWKSLGISHLYASPIFSAASGSTHGYDVTDPAELDPDLGGMDAFLKLSDRLLASGLGLILDIVPNHMAASLENPYWRDVLKWGRRSRYSAFFDTDWNQKLTLPVLAEPIGDVIAAGHGKLRWIGETNEFVFDYHGARYPLDPDTFAVAAMSDPPRDLNAVDLPELLKQQPWEMIDWREAANGLSYRRFFEIAGLVGVRVEDPAVFEATHRLTLDLVAGGRVQGLRIDHIDGLADPAGYLRRLRAAAGPETYIIVEKILEGDEHVAPGWPVAGTSGYEFIADLASLLTKQAPELDQAWQRAAPDFGPPEQELMRAKRLMIEVNFAGEIMGLIRAARSLLQSEGLTQIPDELVAEAVRSTVAGFDVYRTYGTPDGLPAQDSAVLTDLFERLTKEAPKLKRALAFLRDVLFERVSPSSREAAVEFRTRLQHLTGPILAKSLEDTFFYRHNKFIAVNEVGGDPLHMPSDGIAHFHRRMIKRLTSQPHALSATSTHDTKRGEDARARLYAISEAPARWIELVGDWRRSLARSVIDIPGGPAPEPAVEWLIFQALAGVLPPDFDPADEPGRHGIRDRFLPYVEKALREAKQRTNWSGEDDAYEQAVKIYAGAAIGSESFMRGFWRDIQPFVKTGFVNSVSQTLLKLTAPGIPDIYQGSEIADMSLVDPDNRRTPDFEMLAELARGHVSDFERSKNWLVRTGLKLRNQYPELFASGAYLPLESSGERRRNVLAFARQHDGRYVAIVVPRLVHEAACADMLLSDAYWGGTSVHLPASAGQVDVLTADCRMTIDGPVKISDLFRRRPFAVLLAQR